MELDAFVQAAVNGLLLAAVYSLVALGLTLVFGILDIVNFAHGQLLLGGAYILWVLTEEQGLAFLAALPVAVLLVAVAGAVLDAGLFARVRATPINGLLLSIGLIAVLSNVFHTIWGPSARRVDPPTDHVFQLGDVTFPATRLAVIGGTAVALAALAWFLQRTRTGTAIRATAQNAEAAELMGIATERISHVAFAIGAGLAGLAGGFLAMVFPVEPLLGESQLVKAFIVMIIGGAGSPVGAVLGALLLGMTESFAITWWSSGIAELLAFGLLVVVLLIRPNGLIAISRESTL